MNSLLILREEIVCLVILLFLAVAACIFGVARGEVKTVNRKSINICMECIGIG